MRKLRKIRSVFFWTAGLFIMLVCAECVLRFAGSKVSLHPDNAYRHIPDTVYMHIYEPLFDRTVVSGKGTVLECRRFTGRKPDNPVASFLEKKSSGTVRIFIVGGSVAEFMDIEALTKLFDETAQDKVFEIINCGYCGSESFGEKLIVSEILGYSPDLIILFSGNNEYYDTNGYNHRLVGVNRYLRSFRVWCFFQDWLYRIVPALIKPSLRTWEQRHKDFEDNISAIAKQTKAAGVPLLMCTMPANIRDNAPIGNMPVRNEDFLRAYLMLEYGRFHEAETLFENLMAGQPQNPFVFYFAARTQEKLGNFKAARRLYIQAQEYDFPHNQETRATASINNIIRKQCALSGVELADLDEAFNSISEHGITGLDFMIDSCHWHWRSEGIVRKTILRALAKMRNRGWEMKNVSGVQFDFNKPEAKMAAVFEADADSLAEQMDVLFDFMQQDYITSWAAKDALFSDLFLMTCRMFHMAEFDECYACLVSGQEWILRKYPKIFSAFDGFYKRLFLSSASRGLEKENNLDAVRIMLYARACRRGGLSDRAAVLLEFVLEHSLALPRELEAKICIDLALCYFAQGKKAQAFGVIDRAREIGADVEVLVRVLDSF